MGARGGTGTGNLRALPPVHELAGKLDAPHGVAVQAARRAIAEQREAIIAGRDADEQQLVARAKAFLSSLQEPSLRRVLNATGVILHTNLGRAPLAPSAREAVARAASGYSNLELDLGTGSRGSRQAHVEELLEELTGAQAALVVNNGASAVLLAAAALAGAGAGIVVSRGHLVEIGGGFRIPEVIEASGARLIEVGTTNKTRLADYQQAVESEDLDVSAILRVHQSNFRALGFVEEAAIDELCRLGVPVMDDVGSGVITQATGILALSEEPDLRASITAGAALVCCSGDKLLGGPQAGIIVGREQTVAAARHHPLARAARIGKLSLSALEATLRLYRDPKRAREEVPVLAMLELSEEVLERRALRLIAGIGPAAHVVRASSKVGGGALPLVELEGPAVALGTDLDPVSVAEQLRKGSPPVIARIHEGNVLLDPRTLAEDEVELAARVAKDAVGGPPAG